MFAKYVVLTYTFYLQEVQTVLFSIEMESLACESNEECEVSTAMIFLS